MTERSGKSPSRKEQAVDLPNSVKSELDPFRQKERRKGKGEGEKVSVIKKVRASLNEGTKKAKSE